MFKFNDIRITPFLSYLLKYFSNQENIVGTSIAFDILQLLI